MSNLSNEMKRLVERARAMIRAYAIDDGDMHRYVCSELAEEFELWEDDAFPIWLCRVVEGEMRDMEGGAE